VFTYQRATAPKETVRLALLPAGSASESGSVSNLLRKTAQQLAELQSTSHTRFRFISPDQIIRNRVNTGDEARVLLGASHALRATVEPHGEAITVHANLTDVRSGVDAREWTGEYKPGEMRYAPTALVGIVTETLHLPPLAGASKPNEAAQQYYRKGLSGLRSDTTVDAAVASMAKAVAADPDSPLAYAGLAEAQWSRYHATKDKNWLTRATESVRRAEYRNPDLPEVHRISGRLDAEAGSYESAMVEYRRAIELEPDNGEAYRRLGIVYRWNNQLNESLTSFRKAVELAPHDFRVYEDLGALYFYRGEYAEAVKQFRKAVEIAPNEPKAHFNLANVCLNVGLYGEAESEVREAIRLHETPDLLETLGLILMYEGKEQAAIPYFLRATDLSPVEYLAWLHLGTCYRRTKQAAEATLAYRKGLQAAELEMEKDPRDGWVRSGLAYLCVNLGQQLRAASEIAQALRLSPKNAETQFMAVLTYESLHRRDEALAIVSTAPVGTVRDLSRWPDLADLHQDARFLDLLTVRGIR
jgi:tetratricopeptide (TPR) repeat protein